MKKTILDACCGSRMFWFDRQDPRVVFMDNRVVDTTLCDGRKLIVSPDVIGDFRNIPFPDNSFKLVAFDPPHLIRAGEDSYMAQKYGRLNPTTWKSDLSKGFSECFRVLEPSGILVFKWCEEQIALSDILGLTSITPLFGQRRAKTHWLVFMKGDKDDKE